MGFRLNPRNVARNEPSWRLPCAALSPPGGIGRWVPGPYAVLGTDGFGLSEGRAELRDHFEVSAPWIAYAALATQARHGGDPGPAADLARAHGLDLGKPDPASA